jgi:hypothetical protein
VVKEKIMNDETKRSAQLIETAIKNLQATLNEQLACLEESFKSTSGDINTKVAERKSLARSLQLDKKLTELWEEVKYYPNLFKSNDRLKHRLCEIDDPHGDKREKELEVCFTLNGHRYKFTYRDGGSTTGFDGDYFHHAQLSVRDETNATLIEIKISIEHDHVGSVLKPFDVSAFVPGRWIQDFLECYERFQANKKARDLKKKYDPAKVSELRQKFGLD